MRLLTDKTEEWGGDVDALDEMRRSRGYELVRWRIEHELECVRKKLEADSDFATACTLRGYIQALRMVLHLPVTLSTEAEIKREIDHSIA